MPRIKITPEQIHIVGLDDDGRFLIGGQRLVKIPWGALGDAYLYATDVTCLEALLVDAGTRGFQVLDGQQSPRRGLRSFTIGVGAWGYRGKIACQTTDAWALDANPGLSGTASITELEERLRHTCLRLNAEETPFTSSAFRWLGGLYRRLGLPNEPDETCAPLGKEIATFCRRAHVGGPIIHARTTLSPFVHLDRRRSFGSIMLEAMPSGPPIPIKLRGDGLTRWRPRDLMQAKGVAEATVVVHEGPFIPLLPVHKQAANFARSRTLYPTGKLRGTWALCELAWLEESGQGEVQAIHRAVTFRGEPIFADMIHYLRKMEGELPLTVKRFEHIIYGRCARGLTITRLGNGPSGREVRPMDILDSATWCRMHGHAQIRQMRFPSKDGVVKIPHPIYRLTAQVNPNQEIGSADRPDRAVQITARNRVEIGKALAKLDSALKPSRPGEYVGRIYVDGLDIQANIEDIPDIDGIEVRSHGSQMSIYRSTVLSRTLHTGERQIELGSLSALPDAAGIQTEQDLINHLTMAPDIDGGPFAGGRAWEMHSGGADLDPRTEAGQSSVPVHIDLAYLKALGFYEPDPENLLGKRT